MGRLKDSERSETEKHLASCAACRVRVNEFRSVGERWMNCRWGTSPAFDVRVRGACGCRAGQAELVAWLRPSPRIAFAASALCGDLVDWISLAIIAPPAIPPDEADATDDAGHSVMEDHDTLANFGTVEGTTAAVDNADDADDSDHQCKTKCEKIPTRMGNAGGDWFAVLSGAIGGA